MCEIFLINTRPDELDSNNYRFFLEKYKKRMNREKKRNLFICEQLQSLKDYCKSDSFRSLDALFLLYPKNIKKKIHT